MISWMIIKLLISAAIFSCGSKSTRYAEAFVHPHHHRFAVKSTSYITTQQTITRYTSHLSSTPNEIEEGDDFFTQASQQASRQRFQQLKDGVDPLAVSLATTSLSSDSDSSAKEEGTDKKNGKKNDDEDKQTPISQEIKIPNEPQIKVPNEPPSINVIKDAKEAIEKEMEEDKKQVVDPILQSIKDARPDSSADVSEETNESETNPKTQEELEDELRSIKLGAKLAEDAERFWGSTPKDDEVTVTQKDETKDQTPDEVVQEEPTAAKEVEKIRTEEDSTANPTEEKLNEPTFSIDTDEIVAQAMNIEEEGDIVDTANTPVEEEQKKAKEDGDVKVPIDPVKNDQSEDEIAPSAVVEDITTEEEPISSVEEVTTDDTPPLPTLSSDEPIPMPSSDNSKRLSSDGKELYEPKQSEPGEVNQDNVDMGLLVLTQGLFALKSIVDKKE